MRLMLIFSDIDIATNSNNIIELNNNEFEGLNKRTCISTLYTYQNNGGLRLASVYINHSYIMNGKLNTFKTSKIS